MGNTLGRSGGKSKHAVNGAPTERAQCLLQELSLSSSLYFALLPQHLLQTKVIYYVEAALFGAVITRPALCFQERVSAPPPTTNNIIQILQTIIDDYKSHLGKFIYTFYNDDSRSQASSAVPLSFTSTIATTNSNDSLLAIISLLEHPESIAGIRTGYLAITLYGFHIVTTGYCKAWIPWRVFVLGVEICEPIEEIYHIDDAETTTIHTAICYLPIKVRHSTSTAVTRYDTKHLVPFLWAHSLDPIRKLRTCLCLMQTKLRVLLLKPQEQHIEESPRPSTKTATLHERLIMYWPARQQAYLHVHNVFEYRIVPLFASVWLHPWIPFDLLRNTLCVFKLSSDEGVWAICSNGSNIRETPDQRCSLVILSSKILWLAKSATTVKSLDFATLTKCTITELDGDVIRFSHSSFQKTLHYRHQKTEKVNGAYVPSGALQLLQLLQHLLLES